MKRSELETLGLSKEQADAVIKINGGDIENSKKTAEAELQSVLAETDALKEQVKERDKQLDELKTASGDNAELKKQIETLQRQNADQAKAHKAELERLKLDNAIDAALTAAGAKNAKAVRALLDISGVNLGADGKLSGWDEQLAAVQKSDAYLFAEKKQNSFKGFQPGASADTKPGAGVDMSKMSYEELAAYIENNPGTEP